MEMPERLAAHAGSLCTMKNPSVPGQMMYRYLYYVFDPGREAAALEEYAAAHVGGWENFEAVTGFGRSDIVPFAVEASGEDVDIDQGLTGVMFTGLDDEAGLVYYVPATGRVYQYGSAQPDWRVDVNDLVVERIRVQQPTTHVALPAPQHELVVGGPVASSVATEFRLGGWPPISAQRWPSRAGEPLRLLFHCGTAGLLRSAAGVAVFFADSVGTWRNGKFTQREPQAFAAVLLSADELRLVPPSVPDAPAYREVHLKPVPRPHAAEVGSGQGVLGGTAPAPEGFRFLLQVVIEQVVAAVMGGVFCIEGCWRVYVNDDETEVRIIQNPDDADDVATRAAVCPVSPPPSV